MKTFGLINYILLCVAISTAAPAEESGVAKNTGIKENYVMLYYDDLTAPRRFYGELLGLEAGYEDDWVTLYQITPSSHVGVVRAGGTAYHKPQAVNAVMLSLVVDAVDERYAQLSGSDVVKVLKPPYDHDSTPIRAFLLEDPGGYTVEIFQWLK